MRFSLALALSGLFASANAHATFQYIWTDSSTSTNTCVRTPSSNSPVGTTSTYMGCNTPGTGVSSLCTVAAGSTISVEMHQQPGDRTCTTEAIGGNHDGPWIIYLGKVDDATSANPTSVNWIKIAQLGLVSANPTTQVYYWGTDSLNDNCGKATFKIPSSIPSGNYLLRAEVIALHVASSSGGAQHYMSCFQLNITGGGSATLTPTVKFPGGYTLTDPGILFDLYTPFSSYTIPGPALFVDSGSTGGSSGTSTSKASTSTSKASSTSTSKASSTTSAASATQTAYGQCGGIGWTGATTCVSGYTCSYLNDYYSQCVPS